MPTYYWRARCQLCGKAGSTRVSTTRPVPPAQTPSVTGKCPVSLNEKHMPMWEPA